MFKKIFYLVIYMLLIMTQSLRLIPGSVNPLQMNSNSNNALGQSVIVRFSFPAGYSGTLGPNIIGSPGLTYHQFLAVFFPTPLGPTDLLFDVPQSGSPKFSCSLSDSAGTNYVVTPVIPVTSENSIAYCRLDDITNSPLIIGPSIIYTLTINLTFVKVTTTNYFRAVGIFTSTSATPSKMIIDSLPIIGTMAQYNDWHTVNNVLSLITTISNTTSGNIYPNTTFDLQVFIKLTTVIKIANYVLVFRYPSSITGPISVISTAQTTDVNQAALAGNLNIGVFDTNTFFISGITDNNLITGRTFPLTLKGWKAGDTNVGTPTALEVILYYKNTYSIFSYLTANTFTIMPAPITLAINHPEYWDIFRNGAWPLTFTITPTVADISTQGYIVIQHTNTLDIGALGGNKVSFVASTCDFSNYTTSGFDAFGSRPSCFPLFVENGPYPGASSTVFYNGSAIFYKITNTLTAGKSYVLTVWIFADNCGGSFYNWALTSTPQTYTQPVFTVFVYKQIYPANLNLTRFASTDLISSASNTFVGKCWNNYLSSNTVLYPQSFTATDYTPAGATSIMNKDPLPQINKNSVLLFKEFTNWNSGVLNSANMVSTGPACLTSVTWECLATATTSFDGTGFIYGTPNIIGSYFNVRVSRARTAGAGGSNDVISSYFPVPVNGVSSTNSAWYSGKIVFIVPYAWFTTGDLAASCYASWSNGASQGPADTQLAQKSLIKSTGVNGVIQINNSNYFAGNTLVSSGVIANQIDNVNSNLSPSIAPTSVTNIVKLTSIFIGGGVPTSTNPFQFMGDANSALTANPTGTVNIAFFTSCYKWKLPTTIKSIYTYIDIQIQFHYMALNGSPNLPINNTRFIKLYPEGGVFFDLTNGTRSLATPPATNPYTNHQSIVAPGSYAVCLIELNGASLQAAASGDTASNVLSIWLFGGVLIESDYADPSSTYPIGAAATGSISYGMQSAFAMNPQGNNYINNYTANTHNNLNDLIQNYAVASSGSFRSAYFFYMGSNLLITGLSNGVITSGTSSQNLLIPYYCPVALMNINPPIAGVTQNLSSFPIIVAAWMSQPSFSVITSVNRIVQWADSNNTYNVIIPNKIKTTSLKASGDASANGAGNLIATLRWSAYGSSGAANVLFINLGQIDNIYTGTPPICTGLSLFLINSIIFDPNVSSPTFSSVTQNGFYKGTTNFYVLGNVFNSAAFGGSGTMTLPIAPFNQAVTQTLYGYIGLVRPTVDVLTNQSGLLNKLAFFCVNSAASANTVVTNYNSDSNFYLDWYVLAPALGSWAAPTASFDKPLENYNSGQAGNIKFLITPPSLLPIGSSIVFTSTTGFTANTMCGMLITGSLIYQDCTNNAAIISCNVPLAAVPSFTICCYSVTTTDPSGLSSLSINFPTNSLYTSSHISNPVFNASTVIGLPTGRNFSFVSGNAGLPTLPASATLVSVAYSQVSQDGGYGKATFTINLTRDLTRDTLIVIVGDLTAMQIIGTTPRCLPLFSTTGAFGSNWDAGAAILDSCTISLSSTTNPISIVTKREIYKCGLIFTLRTLYVSIWPISQINYSLSSVANNFKVNMNLNSGTNASLTAVDTTGSSITVSTPVITTKPYATQIDTLCAVSQIFPNIVGEMSDYYFDFDLETSKSFFQANSFTIYWPYLYYGSYIPNVLCNYNSVLINCSFTDEGTLNIRYPTNFPMGSGKKITIIISSVPNPGFDVSTFSFKCTVNNVNFSTGVRTNLLVGSGKIANLPTFPVGLNIGELRFLNLDTNSVSDYTPRGISTHIFRIAFDNLLSIQPVLSITNPVIHVYFPTDYNLSLYTTTKPSAGINEYTIDNNYNISSTSAFIPTSVTLFGNRISITLPIATYGFPVSWKYWDIVLTNINNPADTTYQNLPYTQTTRPFSVTLTNDIQTVLYRTNTNLNTYFSTPMTTPLNVYLAYNRGNAFAFDGTKWAIDIYSVAGTPNVINTKIGRFTKASIIVKTQSSLSILPSFTIISLTDTIFKTRLGSYNISTSYGQTVDFYIGLTCGTPPGAYIINFTSSDVITFAPLVPVMVTVDNTTKGTISNQTPNPVTFGGSAWVGYILSDPNFDVLTVTWVPADNNKNDSTSTFSSVVFPSATFSPNTRYPGTIYNIYSVFSITSISTTITDNQTFQTSDPNLCYSFNGLNNIAFILSGSISVIPHTLDLTSSFIYSNGDTDATLLKNQIKFIFTPPNSPAYIYCALVCFNQPYPADADIRVPKLKNTALIQFYTNYVDLSNSTAIIFSGLIRGLQYHMRCILEDSNSVSTQRTNTSINFESFSQVNTDNSTIINTTGTNTTASNSTIVIIAPSVTVNIKCNNYIFKSDPGLATKQAIVNFCQKSFSAPGFYLNGCVYCSFSDLSYILPGLSIPTNTTCAAASSRNLLRFLQINNTTTNTTSNTTINATTPLIDTSISIYVCPVPSVTCATDPAAYDLLSDVLMPDLSKFYVTVGAFSALGNVAWTASYPTSLNCKWQILANSTAPSFMNLWACADPSWCGSSHLTSSVLTFQTSSKTLKAFVTGSSYYIYYACYNQVIGAVKQSIVQNSGMFVIVSNLGSSATATGSSILASTGYLTANGNYIDLSIMIIMIILGFIF